MARKEFYVFCVLKVLGVLMVLGLWILEVKIGILGFQCFRDLGLGILGLRIIILEFLWCLCFFVLGLRI